MAKGKWEDFTDKFGFEDGESAEDRDFSARDYLIQTLNSTQSFREDGIRAVAFDRPGMHNSCLIILLPKTKGCNDEKLLKLWIGDKLKEASIPEDLWDELGEMISAAYEQADKNMSQLLMRGEAREPSHL